jgi:hypothetical protein
MVETVACYGCEMWTMKGEENNKSFTVDMDHMRSAKLSRMDRM